jgi:hypothetical protein
MKQQVTRVSPHQTAKVAAVLMAVTSLIFIIPFALIGSIAGSAMGMGGAGRSLMFIIIAPICYLVFGYIATVISCALYNVLVPFTGGFEYETTPSA